MEIEIFKIDQSTLETIRNTIKDTEVTKKLESISNEIFLSKDNFIDILQKLHLKEEHINIVVENSIIRNSLEFHLKKAELAKRIEETRTMGKNFKLDFYIKLISISSGIILAIIGLLTGFINYNDKIEMQKTKDAEIKKLEGDIKNYNEKIKQQKNEITRINEKKDSVEFIIKLGANTLSNQQKSLLANKNELTRLKESLNKKKDEYDLLETNYNIKKRELFLISKSQQKIEDQPNKKRTKPTITVNRRTWKVKRDSYWLGITLNISEIDEDQIKSVSYTFPEGMGFKDANNVRYNEEYKLKVYRSFEMVIVVVMKDDEVFTKTETFPFISE